MRVDGATVLSTPSLPTVAHLNTVFLHGALDGAGVEALVEEVPYGHVRGLRDEWLRAQPWALSGDALAQALAGDERLFDGTPTRAFAVFEQGRPLAYALLLDGGLDGMLEDVYATPEGRGRRIGDIRDRRGAARRAGGAPRGRVRADRRGGRREHAVRAARLQAARGAAPPQQAGRLSDAGRARERAIAWRHGRHAHVCGRVEPWAHGGRGRGGGSPPATRLRGDGLGHRAARVPAPRAAGTGRGRAGGRRAAARRLRGQPPAAPRLARGVDLGRSAGLRARRGGRRRAPRHARRDRLARPASRRASRRSRPPATRWRSISSSASPSGAAANH